MPCAGLAVNATQLINELELLTIQRAIHHFFHLVRGDLSVARTSMMSDILKKTLYTLM